MSDHTENGLYATDIEGPAKVVLGTDDARHISDVFGGLWCDPLGVQLVQETPDEHVTCPDCIEAYEEQDDE